MPVRPGLLTTPRDRLANPIAELAAGSPLREGLQWFTRERQWISERHLQLCRIPAPTFLEQKRAEWMAAEFRTLGCDARLDRAGNVIATPYASTGQAIAVTAHLDTVLAPRRAEDVAFGVDGRMTGPGVSDNGAGLSALLALAAVLQTHPELRDRVGSLMFIANVGEEGEGNLSGMRHLCRQGSGELARIRGFLVLDGPNVDHITTRALASRRYEIIYTGVGGHSWSDYGIANPVHALARAVTLFAEQKSLTQPGPRSSFNFGVMEGGTSINSIPTEARAKIDLRSESPARLEEMANLLAACVERSLEVENERAAERLTPGSRADSAARVTAKVRELGSRPGGELAESSLLLAALTSVDAYLGIKAQMDCASTDANIPLSLGLEAVSIGAGGYGGGAHTPAEWYHPEGRHHGLQRILLTLAALSAERSHEG